MKRIISLLSLLFMAVSLHAVAITFPQFNTYSEIDSLSQMRTSYKIDMLFDTGIKYGLKLGLGFKNYNVTSLESNFVSLSTIKVAAKPFDLFSIGYFLGDNVTLGNADFGYRGFQYHQRPKLEYIGYKTISGAGFEASIDLLDSVFQPHIYIYQPNDTNLVNADAVIYLKMDTYIIELYGGVNSIDVYTTLLNNTLAKRFGIFVRTVFSKVDFSMGLFSPDSLLNDPLVADKFYLNVTERINIGFFEQTLSIFARPAFYNGVADNVTNDIDVYFAIGGKIDSVGFGIENTILYSSSYTFTDRIGGYFYFMFNSLQYKFGAYYNLMGDAFTSPYGGFISIVGNL